MFRSFEKQWSDSGGEDGEWLTKIRYEIDEEVWEVTFTDEDEVRLPRVPGDGGGEFVRVGWAGRVK